MCDASNFGIDAALLQSHQGHQEIESNVSKFTTFYTSRIKKLHTHER